MEQELKPCPFCGENDLDVTQWIECNTCGAFGPTPEENGDLSNWNRRPEVPVPIDLFLLMSHMSQGVNKEDRARIDALLAETKGSPDRA